MKGTVLAGWYCSVAIREKSGTIAGNSLFPLGGLRAAGLSLDKGAMAFVAWCASKRFFAATVAVAPPWG